MKKDDVGSILKVKLANTTFGLARVIGGGFIEFYDISITNEGLIEVVNTLKQHKVIFTLSVHKSWKKNSGWESIGNSMDSIPSPPKQFMQNFANLDDIKIINPDGSMAVSTREEIVKQGIERVAVWEDNHIEDRLRDYFSGVPNRWLDQLGVK